MPEKPPYRERRCGNCCYGQRVTNQITKVICHGNPPQLFIMGGQGGPGGRAVSVNFESFSPMLDAVRPACHIWEPYEPEKSEIQ